MQCVILAGGLATRLRPITERIPKSMIEVRGRPFLEYQIDLLKRTVSETSSFASVICRGQIEEYFERWLGFGVNMTYSRDRMGCLVLGAP